MATQNSSTKGRQVTKRAGTSKRTHKGGAIDAFSKGQQAAEFAEYMQYMQNRPRLMLTNFLAGLMRGLGFAIGFSILGAIVIMVVQKLALANLPGIGDFFAEVVRIVQMKLY